MLRRAVLLAPLCLLAAACGSHPAAPVRHLEVRRHEAAPTPKPKLQTLQVLVLDGDLRTRVVGARVRLGDDSTLTDAHGLAYFRVRHRVDAYVHVSKAGYKPRAAHERFSSYRQVRVPIYQPQLQWPLYGANVRRTEAQTRIHLRPPFRVVWGKALGGMLEFPAVISDGYAYIGNDRGVVWALSMRTGRPLWRRRLPSAHLAASPAVYGEELVVHGIDGHVWVLARRDGAILWHRTIGSPIESSPLVWHDVDYFGAWNGDVYALDLRRHRFRWIRGFGAKITSSASIGGDSLLIGNYAGRLLALSPRTGRLRWSAAVDGKIYGTPAVDGRRVFVPSSDGGSLTAFTTRGRYLWSFHTGSYVYSSPAVWAGRVVFGAYNGELYCLSARTGAVAWERSLRGPISGAAVVVDRVAYAASFGGRMIGVRIRTGRVVFKRAIGQYVPVSGNGQRLLLHGYSAVYAVESRRSG